jgi:cytochrome P450
LKQLKQSFVDGAGMPMEGDKLQAEVASLIVGGLDTTAQTCSFTL